MFRACSEHVQSMFRVCSGCVSFHSLAHLVCQFFAFLLWGPAGQKTISFGWGRSLKVTMWWYKFVGRKDTFRKLRIPPLDFDWISEQIVI